MMVHPLPRDGPRGPVTAKYIKQLVALALSVHRPNTAKAINVTFIQPFSMSPFNHSYD
jgi:hypothetical protein